MERQVVSAKLDGGTVKLYDGKGSFIRMLGGHGATSVDVSGGYVSIHLQNGRTKLYSPKGQYIRTI